MTEIWTCGDGTPWLVSIVFGQQVVLYAWSEPLHAVGSNILYVIAIYCIKTPKNIKNRSAVWNLNLQNMYVQYIADTP